MLGFKTSSFNLIAKQSLYEIIIQMLIKCSKLMNENCVANNHKIANNEPKITAHLTENYLNNPKIRLNFGLYRFPLRFIIESPENYDINTDIFMGRVDIKVGSEEYLRCINNDDYYTIECKKLDGETRLNKKYVDDGICRFITPPVKYPSYHNKNIMFGFIVKDIDINKNVESINQLHRTKFISISNENLKIIKDCKKENYCLCESSYYTDNRTLLLSHIFYDFSSIIEN